MFHAGAIIALADETATSAAMWETNPTAEFRPELFPLTLQLSANLMRNTNQGTLTAEAEMASERTESQERQHRADALQHQRRRILTHFP